MRARPFTRICAILKPIKLTVSDVLKTTLLVKDAEVVVEISGRYFMLAHRKGSDHFQVVYVSGGRTYKTYVELTEVKLQRGSRLYFICRDTGKRCSALYFDGLNFVSAKAVPASARRLPPRKRLSPDKLLFTKKRARLLGLDGKGPARGMRRDALLLYFKERTDELSAWPDVVAELERKRRQIDRWHMGRVWTALRWQGVFRISAFRWSRRPCVRPMMRLRHAPLAMMPFARSGSRPIARARSATAQNGFSRSGGFNRLGASTPLCPFQLRRRDSSAPKL